MENVKDVIIIGAGVAGMNAALYTIRSGKNATLFEGEAVGGQIANSPKVENFPTIPEISGAELADRLFDQISAKGVDVEYDKVTSVKKRDDGLFEVKTDYDEFLAKAVIAATGVKHKHINVPGEKELSGRGVYYCALCDGNFYAGRETAVIGDGNTAMQYAVLLSNICSKVYVLTWTNKFFGDKALEETMLARENVVHMPETSVTAFEGDGKLENIVYTDKISGETKKLAVPAVFVAIGQVPDNGLFSSLADLDKNGYFAAGEDVCTKTDGFFVAGDCRAKKIRQLATAVSDGAVAAVNACAYIDKNFKG